MMKIGYKGTHSDLTCKGIQYEIGKTYYIDEDQNVKSTDAVVDHNYENNDLKLCSKEVFHYCDKLSDVGEYYSLTSSQHRFFKIQILGAWKKDGNKSGTTSFRILEELGGDSKRRELNICNRERIDKSIDLEALRNMQEKFPMLIIGGSLSLYLRGYNLERFTYWTGDYDMISPYWVDLAEVPEIESTDDEKNSGNDFDDTFRYKGTKIDLRINPNERYEVIKYKGYTYKVGSLIDVIEAKARYALQKGGQKHLQDITELLSYNKTEWQ